MRQKTFATGDFERYRKPTRREQFLAEMDTVVAWDQLCEQIEPFYPKAGNGRPPVGLERMLRIYFLQHWFNLSDPGMEEALYDSRVLDDLLHGQETRVWGDSAYAGQKAVLKEVAPQALDFTQHKASRHRALSVQERSRNRTKSKVRSRVEHVFHVLKCRFGFTRVRYRGLEKNANHLFAVLALVNMVMAKRRLLQA